MSDLKKEKFEITSEQAEKDITINEKPAAEWMEETKYKIFMDLIDKAYSFVEELYFKPDIKELAEKYNISESMVRKHISNLQKEDLIVKGHNEKRGLVHTPQLYVGRKGQPVCAICGSELVDVKEKVTKSDYYIISGKCPICKEGTGQSRAKATVERE